MLQNVRTQREKQAILEVLVRTEEEEDSGQGLVGLCLVRLCGAAGCSAPAP